MLRACVLYFQGKWENYLSLLEYSYNSCYQVLMKMAHLKHFIKESVTWKDINDSMVVRPELIEEIIGNVRLTQSHMKQLRVDKRVMLTKGGGH